MDSQGVEGGAGGLPAFITNQTQRQGLETISLEEQLEGDS